MPELPEVESVRLGLERMIVEKTIATIKVDWPRIITTSESMEEWTASLAGQTITSIQRRGKYLILHLSNNVLISHLRMEGKYHFFNVDELPPTKDKHTHVRFYFTDGSQLHYHDVRKFGRIERLNADQVKSYFEERQLGPEPFEGMFELLEFKSRLSKVKKAIKPALLEQKIVAGLGNIYVDEVLFQSRIHPTRMASQLTEQEMNHLYDAILDVMRRAVEAGGSSVRTYLNSLGEAGTYQEQLQVYGRQQEPCLRCGHPISKIQLAGRGTHYCGYCQKE